MTHHTITDFDRITAAMLPVCDIEYYIWDQLTDGCHWESVGQIIAQLESASCAAGSWGDLIYTRDILDKLAERRWVDDIDTALEEYADATGESFEFSCLSDTVTFAVDWTAQRLASKLRHLDRVAVVVASVDAMDPHPDVIAFDTVYEAQDWIADEIERRICARITDSDTPVTADERDGWIEQESALFTITEERL